MDVPEEPDTDMLHTNAPPRIVASATLLSILAPLPSLSSLAGDANPSAEPAHPVSSPSAKRPRTVANPPSPNPRDSSRPGATVPADVAAAIESVRRAGSPADTLFFPSVPDALKSDPCLRAAIRLPVRELKIIQSRGKASTKTLAWATFFNEADCVAALVALRRDTPGLGPRLHTPRAGGGTAGPGSGTGSGGNSAAPSPRDVFRVRADKIVASGGLANTLLVRGMPVESSEEEFVGVIALFDECCRPLRVRTSAASHGNGKNAKARNFWLTYASREVARAAFQAMSGRSASFRCGKTPRINPVVHNDATDAESKVRRAREAALGLHASTGDGQGVGFGVETRSGAFDSDPKHQKLYRSEDAPTSRSAISDVEKLEEVLRKQPGRLYFLR